MTRSIDVENTFRRLRENHHLPEAERRPMLSVVYDAAREVRGPIVNATAIIVVVFLPLFFLSGVEGRMLRPLGVAYVREHLGVARGGRDRHPGVVFVPASECADHARAERQLVGARLKSGLPTHLDARARAAP